MQLDLARIYFPENLEEPFDVYQEKHFHIKQYFFQRAPIPVVVQKKIKELNELHDAYLLCYPEASFDEQYIPFTPSIFTGNWLDDFHVLQNARTKYKTQLVPLISAKNSVLLLGNWFAEELNYAKIWSPIYVQSDLAQVQISQEPDPMRLLQWLRELPFNPSLENIENEHDSLIVELQNELKRLSKFVALASK
jgi:hypothetical protein